MSYLLWWSRLAWAFADDGFLPLWLVEKHPRYGTPHRVLLLYAALYSLLALVPFKELLIVDVWLFGAYDAMIVWSVLGARRRAQDDPQGFRLPGGTTGVVLNAAILSGTWVLILVATAREETGAAFGGAVALGLGAVTAPILTRFRRRAAPAS
jgi:APA family basic amino acid/polyamine antiporter